MNIYQTCIKIGPYAVLEITLKLHLNHVTIIHYWSAKKAERHKLKLKWAQTDYGSAQTLINRTFYNKVFKIKDQKLAEFNFKVFHKILPCSKNLKKWKKQEFDECEVCHTTDVCYSY